MTKKELDIIISRILTKHKKLTHPLCAKNGLTRHTLDTVFGGIGGVRKYAAKRFPKLPQEKVHTAKTSALAAEIAEMLK